MVLESDCAHLVAMPRSTARNISEIGHIIIEESKGIARLLGDCKIFQVKRDCNHVAIFLACLARRSGTGTCVHLGRPECRLYKHQFLVNKALSLLANKKERAKVIV